MLILGKVNPFDGFAYKFEYVRTFLYWELNVIPPEENIDVVVESKRWLELPILKLKMILII